MAIIRGLFRWSLELTGLSIIWFNFQPYDRQQKLIAFYNFGANSFRTVGYLFGVANQARSLLSLQVNSLQYPQRLEEFKLSSARKLEELGEINKGVYARLGQILSGMTGVLPQAYLTQFKKLNQITPDEISIQRIKNGLTSIFNKPMKEMFDGFQLKPYNVGLFSQEHKSILLDNYKESVVKVMLPSVKYQCDYDLWFINKCLDICRDYIKSKQVQSAAKFQEYENIVKEAQNVILGEINFEKQVQNSDKVADLIEEPSSSFYIPYYYKKYANSNVIIKEYVQGVSLSNTKGLKQLGLSVEMAFAFIMTEVHRLMNKQGLISGSLNERDILIRKYIKPAKRKETAAQPVEMNPSQKKRAELLAKGRELMHSPYQVVFNDLSCLQEVPNSTRDNIQNYWVNMKKAAKKYFPSSATFYERIPNLNNLNNDPLSLMKQKFYLYEPMLKIYEKYVSKAAEKATTQK